MKGKNYTPDSRFKSMWTEAVCVMLGWAVYFAILMFIVKTFGAGDPANYTYLFGLPKWFALCVMVNIGIVILLSFTLTKILKNHPLDAKDPEYDYEKEETPSGHTYMSKGQDKKEESR